MDVDCTKVFGQLGLKGVNANLVSSANALSCIRRPKFTGPDTRYSDAGGNLNSANKKSAN